MKLLKSFSIVVGILFISSCSRSNRDKVDDSISVRLELKPTPVKTARVQVKNFDYLIETSGKVIPLRKQVFLAEYNGSLKIFNGINNKVIKEGEIIAQFDRTSFELELARAQLIEYNAGLEYKSELLGFSKGSGVYVSDSVKSKLEVSSGYGAAKIDLRKAEQAFNRATIFAPFSGVIADVKVQIGSWTKNGDELFTLYTAKDL
jgi:HlyD family secretion protein